MKLVFNTFFSLLFFFNLLQGCQTSIDICAATHQTFNLQNEEMTNLIKKAYQYDNKASFRLYQYYKLSSYDTEKKLFWLRKSAQDGNPVAQYSMAFEQIVLDGDLINPISFNERIYWLKMSASNGDERAKKELERYERILIGYQISEGRPLPVPLSFDLTEAKKMELTEKANKNDNKASFLLFIYGEFYEHGGDNWLRDSAKNGNVVAQYILACDLERMSETEEAMRWLKLAADNGHEEAKKKLEKLKHELKIKSSEK